MVPEQIPVDAAPDSGLPPFRPGGAFTLGAEDELILVDRDGRSAEPADVVVAVRRRHPAGTVSPEIFCSQIEFGTPVCHDAGELAACLASCRAALGQTGQRAVAVGVHPTAALGDIATVHTERYDAIRMQFGGFFRTATAAFQVHVGVPDERAMIAALRAVRNQLAVLRALAAGSPFWHGRDSWLASTRAAIMRSYPRSGPPPPFHSYDQYETFTSQLMAAAEVPGYTQVWWDVRPQPRLGTLEIRVMDAQCSLDRAAGLAALVQGLVRAAVERPSPVDLPTAVLDENDFRAARFGLETRVVDLDGHMRPMRHIAARAIFRASSVLSADGLDEPLAWLLADLEGEPEYERQRRVHAADGMPGLLADLVHRSVDVDESEVDARDPLVRR
jgi:carboxylate-amine ligase